MEWTKVCRLCSSQKTRVRSIFKDYKREGLLDIITDVVRLKVEKEDGLPQNICKPCATTLFRIRDNLNEFRENDRALRERVQKESGVAGVEDSLGKDVVSGVEKSLELFLEQELDEHLDAPETDQLAIDELRLGEEVPEEALQKGDASVEDAKSDYQQSSSEPESDVEEELPIAKLKTIRATKRTNSKEKKSETKRRRARKLEDEGDSDKPKVNDHKCYICKSESLGSAKALLEHLTSHLDRTPFTCTDCTMETVVLRSVRSLNVHLKMHAQPIKCQYCDRRYCDERARDFHVNSFHLGESAPCPSPCEKCGKICRSIAALKSHLRDHNLNLKCEYCDKIFHRRTKFKEHVLRVHEKAEKYECTLCNRVVHSLESYNSHLKMHTSEKTYECDLCPMKFYTAGNLGLHKKNHFSNANYKPHKDWSGHYTVTQEPGADKVYTCKLCGKTYHKTVMKINNHLKNHFKDIQCDRCDLKFVNESQLKTHYVVHTGIREHKCNYCGKDFLHKNNLTQHLKLHRNEQNYACEFCGKTFTYKEGMKAHIRNNHLRQSPYECRPCRRKFVDNASQARHMAAEHEPPPQQVEMAPPPLMGTVSRFEPIVVEFGGVAAKVGGQ